ncbi:MAG: hypothetical protein PGN13_07065 [Patulibacter minatonensis]
MADRSPVDSPAEPAAGRSNARQRLRNVGVYFGLVDADPTTSSRDLLPELTGWRRYASLLPAPVIYAVAALVWSAPVVVVLSVSLTLVGALLLSPVGARLRAEAAAIGPATQFASIYMPMPVLDDRIGFLPSLAITGVAFAAMVLATDRLGRLEPAAGAG